MTAHIRRTLGLGLLLAGTMLTRTHQQAHAGGTPDADTTSPSSSGRGRVPPRLVAPAVTAAGVVAIGAGFWLYGRIRPDLPALQLAGSVEAARHVLSVALPVTPTDLRQALDADYRLIVGYAGGLALVNAVGWRGFARPGARRVAGVAALAALVAGALDVLENQAVTRGLDGLVAPSPTGEGWWRLAAGADVAKLALLVPTVGVGVVTLLVIGRRVLPRRRTSSGRVIGGERASDDGDGCLPSTVE